MLFAHIIADRVFNYIFCNHFLDNIERIVVVTCKLYYYSLFFLPSFIDFNNIKSKRYSQHVLFNYDDFYIKKICFSASHKVWIKNQKQNMNWFLHSWWWRDFILAKTQLIQPILDVEIGEALDFLSALNWVWC